MDILLIGLLIFSLGMLVRQYGSGKSSDTAPLATAPVAKQSNTPWILMFKQNMSTYGLKEPYTYQTNGMEIETSMITLIDSSSNEITAIDTNNGQVIGTYKDTPQETILARLITWK